MSQENVDLVLTLYPGPNVDVVPVFRDAEMAAELFAVAETIVDPDCECVSPRLAGDSDIRTGLEALSAVWMQWLAPWAMLRTNVDDAIDCGDRVLVMQRAFGRREDGVEVEMLTGADIWTVRDGRVVRAELYLDQDEARRILGLDG